MSVFLPPCPAPLPRDQGATPPPPNHEQQGMWKHPAAGEKTQMKLHKEQMEKAEDSQAARDGDKIGPRQPVSPDASRPSGRCLFPSEPEIHPTFTRRGLAG